MEIDDEDNSCWQNLPPVILTEIFSNLSLSERFSASLVCRCWAQAFYTPRIWRTFTFQFEGSSFLPSYDHKAVRFARKFGGHLRKLEISCRRPSYIGCRRVHKKITSFFISLRNKTQLSHLCVRDFNFKRDWRHEGASQKIITSVEQFVSTQYKLGVLDLRAMDVRLTNAVQLLKAAISHCSGTVRVLQLEDFICPREEVWRNEPFKHLMNEWKILYSVSLNYSMLDDDFLTTLIKNNAKSLKKLNIKCRKKENYQHTISNFLWINAVKLCPDLKISLIIERIPRFCQFKHLLQKNLPLQTLKFWTGYEEVEEYWGLVEFATFLKANFANSLETLVFEIEDHFEFMDNALVDLVSSCPNLSEIEITAVLHLITVDVLCSTITEPKSGVCKMHLMLSGLAENDISILHDIKAKHLLKLMEKKIDFHYTTDWVS